MATFTKYICFIILYVSSCDQVYAFSKLGHQVICQLSFNHLPSITQHRINTLLKAIPSSHAKKINHYNHKNKHTEISFASACTWPDAIKRDNAYKKYKSWHYLNIDRNQDKIAKIGLATNNVIGAIHYHQSKILSKNTPWQQLQALMFLAHWVGDIHQPLHVSYKDDLGGNKTKLLNEKCDNLHQYWDKCLLIKSSTNVRRDQKYLVDMLSSRWSSIAKNTIKSGDIVAWANESLTLTRQKNFSYCRIGNSKSCDRLTHQPIKLPKNYVEQYQPILEERILLASVRLHHLLKHYF